MHHEHRLRWNAHGVVKDTMTPDYIEVPLAPWRASSEGLRVPGATDIFQYAAVPTAGSVQSQGNVERAFLVWQLDGDLRRLSLDLIGPQGRLASSDIQFSTSVLGCIVGQCIGQTIVVAIVTGDCTLHVVSVPCDAVNASRGADHQENTPFYRLRSVALLEKFQSAGAPASMAFVGSHLCIGTELGRLFVVPSLVEPMGPLVEMQAQVLGLHKIFGSVFSGQAAQTPLVSLMAFPSPEADHLLALNKEAELSIWNVATQRRVFTANLLPPGLQGLVPKFATVQSEPLDALTSILFVYFEQQQLAGGERFAGELVTYELFLEDRGDSQMKAHIEQGSRLRGKIFSLHNLLLVTRPNNKTGAWIHYDDLQGRQRIDCVELNFGDAVATSISLSSLEEDAVTSMVEIGPIVLWQSLLQASRDRPALPKELFKEACLDSIFRTGYFSPLCLDQAARELGMAVHTSTSQSEHQIKEIIANQVHQRVLGFAEQFQEDEANKLWSNLTQLYHTLWSVNHQVTSLIPIPSDARGQFLIARRNGLVCAALSSRDSPDQGSQMSEACEGAERLVNELQEVFPGSFMFRLLDNLALQTDLGLYEDILPIMRRLLIGGGVLTMKGSASKLRVTTRRLHAQILALRENPRRLNAVIQELLVCETQQIGEIGQTSKHGSFNFVVGVAWSQFTRASIARRWCTLCLIFTISQLELGNTSVWAGEQQPSELRAALDKATQEWATALLWWSFLSRWDPNVLPPSRSVSTFHTSSKDPVGIMGILISSLGAKLGSMADLLGGLMSMINPYMQPDNLISLVRSAYANGNPISVDDIRPLGRVSRFLRTDSALIKNLVMLATANGPLHSEGLYAHYRVASAHWLGTESSDMELAQEFLKLFGAKGALVGDYEEDEQALLLLFLSQRAVRDEETISRAFIKLLDSNLLEEAYIAAMLSGDSDELVDGMRQLIQRSLRREDWNDLLELPLADATVSKARGVFHSLEEEVSNALRLRAQATHCTAKPNPYKMLFELHLAKGQWPAAASIAFSLSKSFQAEKRMDIEISRAAAKYSTLAETLIAQLPNKIEGVRVAHFGGENLVPAHVLHSEKEILRARALLLSLHVMEAQSLSPPDLFQLLLQKDLFREAHALAWVVFEGSQRQAALTTIVQSLCESVLAAQRPQDSPKMLLLREAISSWDHGSELAAACLRRFASEPAMPALPEWLLDSFLRNAMGLQILMKELQDADRPVIAGESLLRYCKETYKRPTEVVPESLLDALRDDMRHLGHHDLLEDLQKAEETLM